jgi:hypothetical protein
MEELYGRPGWQIDLMRWAEGRFEKQFVKNLRELQKREEKKMGEHAYWKFWYVYNPVGRQWPTVKHNTEHRANAEAERLAKANPGQEFLVLEAKRSYTVETNPVKVVEYANLPF